MNNRRKEKGKYYPNASSPNDQDKEHVPGESIYRERERWRQETGYYSVLPSWRYYESNTYGPREQGEFLEELDYAPEQRRGAEQETVFKDRSYGPHAGKGPKNWKRSDVRIGEDISERLFEDSWIDASDIEVQVEQGEVTLKGTVLDRASKRRAEDVAESVLGVSQVHNYLRIEAR